MDFILESPIEDLPYRVLTELGYSLTVRSALGHDWRELADYIGFTAMHIRLIEQESAKAWVLFQAWDRTGKSSVRKLIIALKELQLLSSLEILTRKLGGRIDFQRLEADIECLKQNGELEHLFPRFQEADVVLYPHMQYYEEQNTVYDLRTSMAMQSAESTIPDTVYISYYPDKNSKSDVKKLATYLQRLGYKVFFDDFYKRDIRRHGGIDRWKEWCIERAENIIVVCTPKYYNEDQMLSDPNTRGRVRRPQINVDSNMLHRIAFSHNSSRLIPVLLDRNHERDCVPSWIAAFTTHNWPRGKEDLHYCIAGVPKFKAPEPVERIVLRPREINFPEVYNHNPFDEEPPPS